MRAPPPVEYPSAPGRAWRAALSLLVGAAVAVPLAWGLPYLTAHRGSHPPDALLDGLADPRIQGALGLWTAAMAVAAAWLWQRSQAAGERTLRWDGQDWVLASAAAGRAEQRGDAELTLDLGPWMLVRFLPYAGLRGATWLPLSAGLDLARWAALRGALWNWRAGAGDARPRRIVK
jgi:hypothetical protein